MRSSTLSLLVGAALLMLALPALSAESEGETEEKKPLLYYELEPSIVANVRKGAKYLRADIQLMTREEESLEQITHHAPALRHELFMLISDQEGSQLKDPKGKESFRKRALKALQKVMQTLTGKDGVEDLFFSSFFVQ